jgi:hypothetical protein
MDSVTHDLNRYLKQMDEEDRFDAAIENMVPDLIKEGYTHDEAEHHARGVLQNECQNCFGRGCRKCEPPDRDDDLWEGV